MSTLDEARKAKEKVSRQLTRCFNAAAQSPVSSVGVSKDKAGYHVAVGLERQPTPAETKNLPMECDGVPVKYKVVGPIVSQ